MPDGTPQTTATPAPGATESDQLKQLMERIASRAAQPRMQGPQPMLTPSQQSLLQPDPHPERLTKGLFGLITQVAQQNKQTQLSHATNRIKSISDAIAAAYEKATDPMTGEVNEAKAKFEYMNSDAVRSLLSKEGLKDAKQMEKLQQLDFLNPEKNRTVWHEALEKVAKLSGAEKLIKGLRTIMGQHKDKMAEEQRKQGEAQKKEQEGRELAEAMFRQARPAQGDKGQLTPAQELKTIMDSIKEERQKLDQDRLAAHRDAELAEKTKEFESKQKQQKEEFDTRENLLERREKAWEETRRQLVKNSSDRLKLAGANYELRRIVIGANYIPNMLTPDQQQAIGLQIDEDGNPIPLKSPLSATALTRNAHQQAGVMENLIDTTLKMLDSPELQNKLGPYSGRLSEIIQGKIGRDVPEFDVLRTLGSFDNTGMLKLHFGSRGGTQMYINFKSLLDTGKMDADSLRATLTGYKTVAKAYKKEVSTVRDKDSKGAKDESGDVVIDLRPKKKP